jgi:hypothetical protein
MTKEKILERRKVIDAQLADATRRLQLVQHEIQALDGAIQENNFWLAAVEQAEADPLSSTNVIPMAKAVNASDDEPF